MIHTERLTYREVAINMALINLQFNIGWINVVLIVPPSKAGKVVCHIKPAVDKSCAPVTKRPSQNG